METKGSTAMAHPLEWDDAKVARFWDFISGTPAQQEDYFSQRVGRGVARVLKRWGLLEGRVLDYGCGPGFLLQHLLAAGATCHGFDFSPESIAAVNRKFAGVPGWQGALSSAGSRLPYDDDTFDLVVCLETVEHVLPERLDAFLSELRRILKPDKGRLFLTTPFDENLEHAQIFCPACGNVFHRYQHVRRLEFDTLRALMTSHDFVTYQCVRTTVERYEFPLWPGFADLSLRRLARLAWSAGCLLLDQVKPRPRGESRWVAQYFGEGKNMFWLGGKEGAA
jgi:SAM-dependent methyltransferase